VQVRNGHVVDMNRTKGEQGLPNNAKLHSAVVSRSRLAGKKCKEAGVVDLHVDSVIGKMLIKVVRVDCLNNL